MYAFLKALVASNPKSNQKFTQTLRRKTAEFSQAVGVASTTQGKTRATTAFGLLYAAGSFAQAKKILPKEWDCMAACLAGYSNYQHQLPVQTPFASRLLAIARRPETLDLRETASLPDLTDDQFEAHSAFLRKGTKRRLELLITERIKCRYFRDWSSLRTTAEFTESNRRDEDHATKQRQVRANVGQERFFCFVLNEELRTVLDASRSVAEVPTPN